MLTIILMKTLALKAPSRKERTIVPIGPRQMNMYASTKKFSYERPGFWGDPSAKFSKLSDIVTYGS